MKKDPFKDVPAFLAAFHQIQREGFFEDIRFNGMGFEGKVGSCTIDAVGCVPKNKKYQKGAGCGALVSPDSIIEKCRGMATRSTIKSVYAAVETNDWPLYDASGNNLIGSKGVRIKLSFSLTFKM